MIAIIGQLMGIALLFFNRVLAAIFFACDGVAFVWLIVILIKERQQEKKEMDEHDYRDY